MYDIKGGNEVVPEHQQIDAHIYVIVKITTIHSALVIMKPILWTILYSVTYGLLTEEWQNYMNSSLTLSWLSISQHWHLALKHCHTQ